MNEEKKILPNIYLLIEFIVIEAKVAFSICTGLIGNRQIYEGFKSKVIVSTLYKMISFILKILPTNSKFHRSAI